MQTIQGKKWYGWLPVSAAVLMLSFWIGFALFLPMEEAYINWVMDPDWTWLNLCGFTGSILSIFAIIAIFSFHSSRETIDFGGLGLTMTGTIILTCILFFETFILKAIASQNQTLIDLNGSFNIYKDAIFQAASISGGIFLSIGFIILGLRMYPHGIFKKWQLILMMIACPLFGIVIIPGNLRLLGVLLFAVGFIAMGTEMLKYNRPDGAG